MEFLNFILLVEILLLLALIAPMYYKIPHNFNQNELFLDIRNRQGLSIVTYLCYRGIDFVLIKAGDTTRINAGTCMHSEMLTILAISWTLWLEIVLFVSAGAANSVKHIKIQILCFLCPLLLMAPCALYNMFQYTPTTYRVLCTFKVPSDAETHQIGVSSALMLALTLWVPAHSLLIMSYKRFKLNLLTITMIAVCLSLYVPEILHFLDANTNTSQYASTSRKLILIVLAGYLNSSLAGKLNKDVV